MLQRSGTGSGSGSPASPGKFTNLFSASTLSLSMGGGGGGANNQEGSPRRESGGGGKKKEEVRWPEECELSIFFLLISLSLFTPRTPRSLPSPSALFLSVFDDFRTSIWCTYRSQYAPITHLPPHLLVPPSTSYDADGLPLPSLVGESIESMRRPPIARPSSGWAWVKGGGGDEKGLTTDSGWGCMLRTGQSLLANSLVRLHLGRGE